MTVKQKNEIMETESLKEPMAIDQVFAESGMFPDTKTQAQACVKILAGRELNLSPFESMKNLYLVNGKLGIQANGLASLIKKSMKYDYKVESLTDKECKIKFIEITNDGKEKELGLSEFTFQDAAKAGIVNKDVWKNYPKNMLFARALSNGVRFYCPDAACGWHSTEELEDIKPTKQKEKINFSDDGVKTSEIIDAPATTMEEILEDELEVNNV